MAEPSFEVKFIAQSPPFQMSADYNDFYCFSDGIRRAFVDPDVAAQLIQLARDAWPHETGGLLAGRIRRDVDGPYTVILGFIQAPPGAGRSGSFHMSPELTDRLRGLAARAYRAADVIGWWHTHPAPSNYSSTDRDTQRMWTAPESAGLLVFADSIGSRWGTIYLGPEARPLTAVTGPSAQMPRAEPGLYPPAHDGASAAPGGATALAGTKQEPTGAEQEEGALTQTAPGHDDKDSRPAPGEVDRQDQVQAPGEHEGQEPTAAEQDVPPTAPAGGGERLPALGSPPVRRRQLVAIWAVLAVMVAVAAACAIALAFASASFSRLSREIYGLSARVSAHPAKAAEPTAPDWTCLREVSAKSAARRAGSSATRATGYFCYLASPSPGNDSWLLNGKPFGAGPAIDVPISALGPAPSIVSLVIKDSAGHRSESSLVLPPK